MLLLYTLAFCRIMIIIAFIASFARKIGDIAAFERTIANFDLFPRRYCRAAAILVLGGEIGVAIQLVVGGELLLTGFLLATLLLAVFCLALTVQLIKGRRVSCNCFGRAEKEVSSTELWRNGGFAAGALGGEVVLIATGHPQESLGVAEWALIGLAASVFMVVWLHLGEVASLFRK